MRWKLSHGIFICFSELTIDIDLIRKVKTRLFFSENHSILNVYRNLGLMFFCFRISFHPKLGLFKDGIMGKNALIWAGLCGQMGEDHFNTCANVYRINDFVLSFVNWFSFSFSSVLQHPKLQPLWSLIQSRLFSCFTALALSTLVFHQFHSKLNPSWTSST